MPKRMDEWNESPSGPQECRGIECTEIECGVVDPARRRGIRVEQNLKTTVENETFIMAPGANSAPYGI
jgi:hypothetical protein